MAGSKNVLNSFLLIGIMAAFVSCANKPTKVESAEHTTTTSSSMSSTPYIAPPGETREIQSTSASRRASVSRASVDEDRLPASVESDSTTTFNRTTFMDPVPGDETVASQGTNYIWLIVLAIVVLLTFAAVRKVRTYRRPVK